MCGDAERARELAQDAFIRAWERLGSFRGESAFSSWLYRLTANVVLEAHRAQGRRTRLVWVVPEPEALERGGDEAPLGARMDLEKAIAGLPPGARAVLVLHAIEGYRYEEIAEMTGLALGTVKAQIHRARRLLREAMS